MKILFIFFTFGFAVLFWWMVWNADKLNDDDEAE
tara:strand:- start:5588 stop:5689 length:102 start_codon:yes stop_codon:yes gene_type:complete